MFSHNRAHERQVLADIETMVEDGVRTGGQGHGGNANAGGLETIVEGTDTTGSEFGANAERDTVAEQFGERRQPRFGRGAANLKRRHQQEPGTIPVHDRGVAVDGGAAGGSAVAAVDSASCGCSVAGFERTVGGAPVCAEPS